MNWRFARKGCDSHTERLRWPHICKFIYEVSMIWGWGRLERSSPSAIRTNQRLDLTSQVVVIMWCGGGLVEGVLWRRAQCARVSHSHLPWFDAVGVMGAV